MEVKQYSAEQDEHKEPSTSDFCNIISNKAEETGSKGISRRVTRETEHGDRTKLRENMRCCCTYLQVICVPDGTFLMRLSVVTFKARTPHKVLQGEASSFPPTGEVHEPQAAFIRRATVFFLCTTTQQAHTASTPNADDHLGSTLRLAARPGAAGRDAATNIANRRFFGGGIAQVSPRACDYFYQPILFN